MNEQECIDFLESKGYIIFDSIIELKKIVLETATEDELIKELLNKKFNNNDCGCGK